MDVIGLVLAFGLIGLGVVMLGLSIDTWALSRRWSK